MKLYHLAPLAALALVSVAPAVAQTTAETKVSTKMASDGTKTTKVVRVHKRKTHRPKKILGVKVGHKTVTHKTVHETTTGPNGASTTTKTQ